MLEQSCVAVSKKVVLRVPGQSRCQSFTIPGIYAYWCVPHKTMGMIGFVIVDNDLSNLDSIKKVKFIGKSKKIAAALIAEIEG